MKHLAPYLPLVLLGSLRLAEAQQPPAVTVCQLLANPQQYNGRIIALRGIYQSGVDVSGLAGEGCDGSLVTDGYTWPSFIWLAYPNNGDALHKSEFVPDRATFDKLAEMLRRSGFDNHLYSASQRATVTFIGLFETYDDLSQRVRSTRFGLRGFGFGNDNLAPGQLLVKTISLSDVEIRPKGGAPK